MTAIQNTRAKPFISVIEILADKTRTCIYKGLRGRFSDLKAEINKDLNNYADRVTHFLCSNDIDLPKWAANLKSKIDSTSKEWTYFRERLVPEYYKEKDGDILDRLESDFYWLANRFDQINTIFAERFPKHATIQLKSKL